MNEPKSKLKSGTTEQNPSEGQNRLYLIYIFITGAATLSMELLASRILTPYFGVSLFIWSGILSITLIALSLGYYLGGQVTRKPKAERRSSLDYLFLLMPAISGIALVGSCLLYPKTFHTFGSASLVMGAYFACVLLIFIPLVAVSAMNPLLIAIQTERQTHTYAGGDSGSGLVFFISTVGSVVGVSITAFGFIPNATNFNSMLVLSTILSLTSLSGALFSSGISPGEKRRLLAVSALGVAVSVGLFAMSSTYLKKNEAIVFEGASWSLEREYTSMFGNTKILAIAPIPGTPEAEIQERLGTLYYNDGITQNIIDHNGASLTPFTYALEFLATGLRPDASRALMLGLGAGIIPMELEKRGVDVDVVEIDPSSIAAAKDYFGFDPAQVNVVQTDARTFVRSCDGDYDFVLMDMAHGDGLPDYLLTTEFFSDLRGCLAQDGIAVLNTYAATAHLQAYYSIVKSLNAVFPEIWMYHDGISPEKPAVSVYLAAFQRANDTEFVMPRGMVPAGIAPTLKAIFAERRQIDADLLANADLLEDDFNRFSFINLESDQFFRESVLATLPPEFLAN
jgi:predicted membrane-bound spermidine synthase